MWPHHATMPRVDASRTRTSPRGEAVPTLKIASTSLSAEVSTTGAELQNLCDADGRSLQWNGDPAVWSGRAPILFPVIGMLQGGGYRLDGHFYAMPKHGFARHAVFEVVEHSEHHALLRLEASDATRAAYPFAFRLDIAFGFVDHGLCVVATVFNHDVRPMPASFGFHPAFRWPLPFGAARADHVIAFAHDQHVSIRRLDAEGFLRPGAHANPIVGDTLALRDDLFVDDALIVDGLAHRQVRYGAPDGPGLVVRFDDFPTLGVWTRPGAPFICIEPWQGYADPVGWDGDFRDKPGVVMIEAGESRAFGMRIDLDSGTAPV
jgi:galactose mutarotase-like enzyme